MNNTNMSALVVNTQANAGAALYNNGYLRIYGGNQPASTDEPIADQPLLVEGQFAGTAWDNAVEGELLANEIVYSAVLGSARASFARFFAVDGVTALHDTNVGEIGSGAGIEVEDPALVEGASFEAASIRHLVPRS